MQLNATKLTPMVLMDKVWPKIPHNFNFYARYL